MSQDLLVNAPDQKQSLNVIAVILGKPLETFPEDLYIPPQALRIFLAAFEGPLDLLLYLIRKHDLDILNIPVAAVTMQYMAYINLMRQFNLDLAGDYLVMAATLAEIKSRLLLPHKITEEETEVADPRAELVRRLQIYERFKVAAEQLDLLPRYERDIFPVQVASGLHLVRSDPDVSLDQLLAAFKIVLKSSKMYACHTVRKEMLSIHEKMVQLLARLHPSKFILFEQLFIIKEGRLGVVVSFIAILELVKQSMIELTQDEPLSPIYIRRIQVMVCT